MQLMNVLTKQQTRTMVPVTRRGTTIYLAGSAGTTYRLDPFTDPRTGEILYACSCPSYTGVKDGIAFRPSKRETLELCKHGRVLNERKLMAAAA